MTVSPIRPWLPRGTVWPWPSMVLPPDGWAFLPTRATYYSHAVLGIVALRDHDTAPRLPDADDDARRVLELAADSSQQKLLDGRTAAARRAEAEAEVAAAPTGRFRRFLR